MPYSHALAAGAVAGVASVFTSWLITGVLFHRFQRRTPATWRPEGPWQYGVASAINLGASLVIAVFFTATGGLAALGGPSWLSQGLVFGALAWLGLAAPVLLSMGLFVNLHRGVVVGLLLDWLVVCLMASLAAAWALAR